MNSMKEGVRVNHQAVGFNNGKAHDHNEVPLRFFKSLSKSIQNGDNGLGLLEKLH